MPLAFPESPKYVGPAARTVRIMVSQLAKHLDQHYDSLRDAFLHLDTDRNTWISNDEFAARFHVFNFPITNDEMEALVDAFDYNKDGRVSWLEFCNTLSNGPWSPMKVTEAPIRDKSPPPTPPPKPKRDPVSDAAKAILMQMAKHLEAHYDGLRGAFLNVDTNRNGWISKDEFAALFQQFNFPITSEELDILIDAFDYDRDGRVSYLEFCNTLLNGPWAPLNVREWPPRRAPPTRNGPQPDEVKLRWLLTSLQRALEQRFPTVQEAFRHLDTSRSGFISAQELLTMLHNSNCRATWEDAQMLVDYFDTNNDGLVSWQEFAQGIQMNKWNPRGAGDSQHSPPTRPRGVPGTFGVDPSMTLLQHVHLELRKYTATRYDNHKAAFLAINTSRCGALTKSEFGLALAKASDQKLSAAVVDRLFETYDANGDGFIQLSEYVRAINRGTIE